MRWITILILILVVSDNEHFELRINDSPCQQPLGAASVATLQLASMLLMDSRHGVTTVFILWFNSFSLIKISLTLVYHDQTIGKTVLKSPCLFTACPKILIYPYSWTRSIFFSSFGFFILSFFWYIICRCTYFLITYLFTFLGPLVTSSKYSQSNKACFSIASVALKL